MLYESNRPLRILHLQVVIGETDMVYNEHSLPLADERDITICTFFGSDMKPPKTITLLEGDGSFKGFFRALKTALTEKEYDIIHAHSPHLGFLFLTGTLFNYPKYKPSTVATVQDSYPNYKLRNRIMWLPVFASFQRVVFCSHSSFNSFPAYFRRLTGDRHRVVQNSLDIARVDRVAANTRQRPQQTDDFAVVAISRLVEIKNPFCLLDAFQQSADETCHLVYMGDGPLRDSLITKRREFGLENQIEFTGIVPREKVFEHVLNADLFISTSRGEGLPVAVIEAMACSCPVLLSDIPPHREIAEGVDFIPLIQPDDVAGFAREIRKFREMPISERTRIGQKCRKLVQERFSLPAMHSRYAEVYAQITGNHIAITTY